MVETGHKPPIIPRPLYAVTIHETIGKGDLASMKSLAAEAEKYGDVSAALQVLNSEIAKAEAAKK